MFPQKTSKSNSLSGQKGETKEGDSNLENNTQQSDHHIEKQLASGKSQTSSCSEGQTISINLGSAVVDLKQSTLPSLSLVDKTNSTSNTSNQNQTTIADKTLVPAASDAIYKNSSKFQIIKSLKNFTSKLTSEITDAAAVIVSIVATRPHISIGLVGANACFLLAAPMAGMDVGSCILSHPAIASFVALSHWALVLTNSIASHGLHKIKTIINDSKIKVTGRNGKPPQALEPSETEAIFNIVHFAGFSEKTLSWLDRGSFLITTLAWPYVDAATRKIMPLLGMHDTTSHVFSFLSTFAIFLLTDRYAKRLSQDSPNPQLISKCLTLSGPTLNVTKHFEIFSNFTSAIIRKSAESYCKLTNYMAKNLKEDSKVVKLLVSENFAKCISVPMIAFSLINLSTILIGLPTRIDPFKQIETAGLFGFCSLSANTLLLFLTTMAGVSPYWYKLNSDKFKLSVTSGVKAKAHDFIMRFPNDSSLIFKRGAEIAAISWWPHADTILQKTFLSISAFLGAGDTFNAYASVTALVLPFWIVRAIKNFAREVGRINSQGVEGKSDQNNFAQNSIAISSSLLLARPIYNLLNKTSFSLERINKGIDTFFMKIAIALMNDNNLSSKD